MIKTPRDTLLPYQRAWVEDRSRAKFALWARQTGKDHSNAPEVVETLMERKTTWVIAAPSERQSLESLDKVKMFAEAYQFAIENYAEIRDGGAEALLKSAEVHFPNGSRCIAVPGKPATVRGMSANITLTEFAFFESPDETWRALLPSITNNMRGGEKVVRILTTPNGIGNKAHDLWMKGDGKKLKWSRHKVALRDAIAAGLDVDYDELAELMGDPEGVAQELDCEFLDAANVLLPYELLAQVEAPEATLAAPAGFWEAKDGRHPIYAGIDFARSSHLTVFWAVQKVGPVAITREIQTMRGLPTNEQFEILRRKIERCQRVCLDYTGVGVGFGDECARVFGEWNAAKHKGGKVELCQFTNSVKTSIFPNLRASMEKIGFLIPSSREVREDLHSVYRIATPSGGITYSAPFAHGTHADRATAAALANRAASMGGAPAAYQPVAISRGGRKRFATALMRG